MEDLPPPLPVVRPPKALPRGPLIFTAISRVVFIPIYLLCAVADVNDLRMVLSHPRRYVQLYVMGTILLAASLWFFFIFSVLLAWLFFSRRRMFRPLMIYFSVLVPAFFAAMIVHTTRFPPLSSPSSVFEVVGTCISISLLFSLVFWPIYYAFSPRVKRVFVR